MTTDERQTVAYVPIVTSPTPPSPRARELAGEISKTIIHFEQRNPSVTRAEVREATRMAIQATGGGGSELAAVAGVLGVLVLAGLGGFLFVSGADGGSPTGGDVPYTLMAVAAGLIVAAVVFVLRRRP